MDFVEQGLALAGLREALNTDRLQEHGVEAILQLYTHTVERLEPPFACEVLHLQVYDRELLPEMALRRGLEFINANRAAGRTVLVVCGAGTSRSASFVAGYLFSQGMPLTDAFRRIARARPVIQTHRRLVESLIDLLGAAEPLEEVCAAAQSRG